MHSATPDAVEATPAAIRQLWGLAAPSSRGPRATVGLVQVADAAVAIADDGGFEAVTLGAVATRLGLTTTALYRYVDAKDTLVELMVDAALGAAPEATDITGWVDALWERYAAHPWLATYPLVRAPRCPNAFAWLARLVDLLDAAEAREPLALATSLDVLVRGYAGLIQAAAASELPPELATEIARQHPSLMAVRTLPDPHTQLHALVATLVQASRAL